MTIRTERQQDIEQVASLIAEADLTPARAYAINGGAGWTYEVRYDSTSYLNPTDYSRIEGRSLSPGELGQAVALAVGWG